MIKLTAMEFIIMPTALDMKANGKTTSNMDKEQSIGLMAVNILANMWTPRNKAKGSIYGQTETNTLVIG